MAVACELNKFAYEVKNLPVDEFCYWIAFFEMRHKETEKRRQEAERNAKRGNPLRRR